MPSYDYKGNRYIDHDYWGQISSVCKEFLPPYTLSQTETKQLREKALENIFKKFNPEWVGNDFSNLPSLMDVFIEIIDTLFQKKSPPPLSADEINKAKHLFLKYSAPYRHALTKEFLGEKLKNYDDSKGIIRRLRGTESPEIAELRRFSESLPEGDLSKEHLFVLKQLVANCVAKKEDSLSRNIFLDINKYYEKNKYELVHMSKKDFDQRKDWGEPILVKMDDNTYTLWGFKENKWQSTPIPKEKLPNELVNSPLPVTKVIFSKTPLYDTLKIGHNQEENERQELEHIRAKYESVLTSREIAMLSPLAGIVSEYLVGEKAAASKAKTDFFSNTHSTSTSTDKKSANVSTSRKHPR